jgi:hypothetical protein
MAGPLSQVNAGGTLGYVDAVGYFRNPGLLTGRPCMPFFMASDQVCDQVPAVFIDPLVD